MLETLQEWLSDGEGSTEVTIRLSNASSYAPYLLRAVDEGGVVVSPTERPNERIIYPWASIFGIMERQDRDL